MDLADLTDEQVARLVEGTVLHPAYDTTTRLLLNEAYRLGQAHERARRRCYRCGKPATVEIPDSLEDATGATGPAFVCDACHEERMR